MKELSIEEKAKAYDEALKVLHKYDGANIMFSQDLKEEMFPELKKSEDERIRKEIIKYFKKYPALSLGDYNVQDILAWLEKQGEHANFFNKIQIGDKVTRNRDGVLVNLSQLNRVAKPAERQQKPAFEMITPEESLGIDSDTYNKIVDECIYGEQKPVCSEEQHEKESLSDIENSILNFAMQFHDNRMKPEAEWEDELKMLRDNIKIDPWSEEDEEIYNLLYEEYKNLAYYSHSRNQERDILGEILGWLKSLKNRYTWKPSNEQMLAIDTAINVLGKGTLNGKQLIELQEQLKKLKG